MPNEKNDLIQRVGDALGDALTVFDTLMDKYDERLERCDQRVRDFTGGAWPKESSKDTQEQARISLEAERMRFAGDLLRQLADQINLGQSTNRLSMAASGSDTLLSMMSQPMNPTAPAAPEPPQLAPMLYCEWPDCYNEAFVTTGNAAGALVCRQHFEITNGKKRSELNDAELMAIDYMVRTARQRQAASAAHVAAQNLKEEPGVEIR